MLYEVITKTKTESPETAERPPLAERVFELLLGNWMIEREIVPKGT